MIQLLADLSIWNVRSGNDLNVDHTHKFSMSFLRNRRIKGLEGSVLEGVVIYSLPLLARPSSS